MFRNFVLAVVLLTAACANTKPNPTAVLATVETAYVALATLELAYKNSPDAEPEVVAEMLTTDRIVYSVIVSARQQVIVSQSLSGVALRTVINGLIKNKDLLLAHYKVSPQKEAGINAAISLVQLLEGVAL